MDKETAIRILKGIVNTQNIRGTDLISIRVRHTNKEDARDVTAEVAKAYREYRMETQRRGAEQGQIELRKAVKEQEEKVEERRKILDPQDNSEAKRDFETEQKLLWSMKLKQTNDSITAKMQDETIVIHEEPQIGQAPVSPNVTLNLVLGTVLGLLLSPLLSLPVILLLSSLMPVKVAARLG